MIALRYWLRFQLCRFLRVHWWHGSFEFDYDDETSRVEYRVRCWRCNRIRVRPWDGEPA